MVDLNYRSRGGSIELLGGEMKTINDLIEFLLAREVELGPETEISWGGSSTRPQDFEPEYFEVVDGRLHLNTYEGM